MSFQKRSEGTGLPSALSFVGSISFAAQPAADSRARATSNAPSLNLDSDHAHDVDVDDVHVPLVVGGNPANRPQFQFNTGPTLGDSSHDHDDVHEGRNSVDSTNAEPSFVYSKNGRAVEDSPTNRTLERTVFESPSSTQLLSHRSDTNESPQFEHDV